MSAVPPPKRSASKPLLIGCGMLLVLLLACAGVFTFLGRWGMGVFHAQREQIAKDEEFVRSWNAPAADAPAAAFAPASVAGYELAESDEKAAFPAVGLDREGSHAVYKRGDDVIEVAVYRADEAAKSAVFAEVERRIDDEGRFKSHTFVRLPSRLTFGVTDPTTLYGLLWHARGWLVFVRSTTVADLDPFLRAYLEEVGAKPGGEAEEAGGAKGDRDPVEAERAATEEE